MTVENILPHGLKRSVIDTDYETEDKENLALLDKNRMQVGLFANRPTVGIAERFYYATDTGDLYYDDGTSWLGVADAIAGHASSHAVGGSDALIHQNLSGAGSNSHAQLDTHLADSAKHFAIEDFSRRNTALNGGFKVWQRGTATTNCPVSTETYLADRIFVKPAGATMSQARSATVRAGALEKYSLLLTGAASVTTVNVSLQRYEAINIPAVKGTVSFSIWVLNNSGADFTPTLLLGTPSAEDNYATVTNRLTQVLGSAVDGVWTKLTHTVDILGYTNIDFGLQVELQIPSGSMVAGDTVNVMEFQLERSLVVTPFEYKSFGEELYSCKRYLPVGDFSGAYDIVGMVWVTSATVGVGVLHFDVEPRVAPTGLIATASDFAISTEDGLQTLNSMTHDNQTSKHTARLTISWATGIPFATAPYIQVGTLSAALSPVDGKILFTGCEL